MAKKAPPPAPPPRPKDPEISIVIVNFNGKAVLTGCLESIPPGVETVVVDNASKDGSADDVAARFPAVGLVRNAANRGFAAAVNQGIAATRGRYVCLLNSDARLAPDTLETMIRFMDATPSAGMAAPQLLHEDGRKQHSFDNFPSLATAFLNKSLLRLLFPGKYPSKRQEFTEPREVESVIGACMFVRRELIDRIGPLDEAYFLFLEETDWCLRCRRSGSSVWFVPGSKVVHLQGKSRDQVRFRARIEYTRSLFTYFRRNRPGSYPLLRLLFPLRTLLEFLAQTLALPFKGVARRWAETSAVLGWLLCGCPRSWGLSAGADRRFLKLRDGWNVEEGHLEAFADFDRAVDKGRVLKEAKYKKTMEVEAGGRSYRVKIERKGRWFRTLRHWILGSKAAREGRVSGRVAATGIPCAPVVAWGDRSFGSAAVVEKVAGGRSLLDVFKDPALPAAERRRLLRAYGRFARRVHDAGIAQYDFAPVNVLLADGRLLLIDFEWTKVTGRPLPESERLRALGKISRYGLPSRADQVRFLHGYTDAHADEKPRLAALFGLLRAAAQRTLEADVARAAERCVEENRDFARFEADGFEGHYLRVREDRVDPGLKLDELRALLGKGGEEVPDAIDAWKRAHQAARRGSGPRPLAVARRRGETPGRLYWSRNVQAPNGVEQV